MAFAAISFSSFAREAIPKYKFEDWSFGVSGGTNVFGHLNREGHAIKQKHSLFLKASAYKKISPEYSLGVSLTQQLWGKIKDSYTVGIHSHSVDQKYSTTAVLINGKYFFEDASKFKPYIGAGIGFSLNAPKKEVHVGGATTTTFAKRGAHIQPAATIFAGIGYEISKSQKVTLEYQLLYSGKSKTGVGTAVTGGRTTVGTRKLSNNLFHNILTVGLEFKV